LTKAIPVSFIIPTLRRPDFLHRCLSSLALQRLQPSEVLVGLRTDDDLSRPIVSRFSNRLTIKPVEAKGVGVVGSMNSCLAEATGDFIGLVDDDVELPPEWLGTMIYHLQNHPEVLGVSGRDFLLDDPPMRRAEPRILDVGRLHWFGRITGNHHRGAGRPRTVDLLRGSNCLYRADFLRSVGFDENLRGEGAQVHWELALALHARQRRKRLFYDPGVEVLHHVAPRMDRDQLHRGRFDYNATVDLAHNETFVILKYGSGLFRVTALLWQSFVGSSTCPGAAILIRSIIKLKPLERLKVQATLKGRSLAWITFVRSLCKVV
jgi:GT2 family glycosyltransferase